MYGLGIDAAHLAAGYFIAVLPTLRRWPGGSRHARLAGRLTGPRGGGGRTGAMVTVGAGGPAMVTVPVPGVVGIDVAAVAAPLRQRRGGSAAAAAGPGSGRPL